MGQSKNSAKDTNPASKKYSITTPRQTIANLRRPSRRGASFQRLPPLGASISIVPLPSLNRQPRINRRVTDISYEIKYDEEYCPYVGHGADNVVVASRYRL